MVIIFNQILGIATLALQIISLVVLVSLLTPKLSISKLIIEMIGKHALLFALLLTGSALVGSLIYSEVAGFDPCKLCWIQRVLMYPQMIILAIGFWKKDSQALLYSFVLSVIGIAVALFQYYGQLVPASTIGSICDTSGGVSCTQRLVFEFGYITIPLMSATIFLGVILIYLSHWRYRKTQ